MRFNKQTKKQTKMFCMMLGAAIFATLFPLTLGAYEPPIGIPDPSWGSFHPIDSSAPSWPTGWPESEAAGCYYIDNTHPNATDIGNTFGCPNRPRIAIPEIAYNAGSYIEVHGGPYTGTNIYVSFYGTEQNPCWFRGSSGDMPVFTGNIIIMNSSYAILEFLHFNGGTSGCISIGGVSTNHVCVRNSVLENRTWAGNTAGIGILPSLSGRIHDVVIYNCAFRELGSWQTENDEDFHGIVPSLWGRDSSTEENNIWILDNAFYHLSGNGVQVNAGNWADSYKYLHHIYIGKNTAHALRQAGFWSKQASDVIISENVVYDNRSHGPQPGDGLGYQYRPNNLWMIFNTIHDCNYGVRQSATDGWGERTNSAYIIGNVIYHVYPEDVGTYDPLDYWRKGVAVSFWQGDMNRYIADNTIYDCYNGINAIQTGEGSGLEVSSNLISEIEPASFHVSAHQNVDQDVDINHCLFHDPEHNSRFRWGGAIYTDLSSFNADTGECPQCLQEDPLFVNASVEDFRIRNGSPARDSSIKHFVYDVFFGLYGINIAVDKTKILRPQGSGWDIGAYEYQDGVSTDLLGDVNNDSFVNALDVEACINHILGKEDFGAMADVNSDGRVDIRDVQSITNIILAE